MYITTFLYETKNQISVYHDNYEETKSTTLLYLQIHLNQAFIKSLFGQVVANIVRYVLCLILLEACNV